VLEPLRALRLDLSRRVVALALRETLSDPNGFVRAAAVEACAGAFPDERGSILRQALVAPMEDVERRELVSLRALELLARDGLPGPPAGVDAGQDREEWIGLLGAVLRSQLGGAHAVAACRALQRILGGEESLRPEVWLARLRERGSPGSLGPGDSGTRPGGAP